MYGLSALFVAMGNYTIIFFVAGALLPLIAVLWMLAYPKLVRVRAKGDTEEVVQANNRFAF